MSSDQQLQTALERILSGLRAQLDAGLRAYGNDVARASAADRARAIEQATEEVRRQAHEQLAQLREAANKQNADLRRSAEQQIGELRRLLDDLRRNAQQQIETARNTVETEVAATRAQAAADVEAARRAAQLRVEELQQSTDARLAEMAHELEQARSDLTAARQQLETAETPAVRAAESHLAGAIRAIDESGSLVEALDRLVEAAAAHCDRAALLILREDRLGEWRSLGFARLEGAQREELTADDAGLAGTAAREARVLTRTAPDGPPLPRFAASPAPQQASAFPLTVAGVVVAVLYADIDAARPQYATWVQDLDVLARHAGRLLEAITVQQATGLRAPGRVARASQPASPTASAVRSAPADTAQPPLRGGHS